MEIAKLVVEYLETRLSLAVGPAHRRTMRRLLVVLAALGSRASLLSRGPKSHCLLTRSLARRDSDAVRPAIALCHGSHVGSAKPIVTDSGSFKPVATCTSVSRSLPR